MIAFSGSACPAARERVIETFGDVLYNLYGSTEVAWATIATPEDLRAAPGTAGQAARGTIVRLFDADGDEVPPGERGRIFVANEMLIRRLHRRRRQRHHRRPDAHRRRRLLRQGRTSVHRGPRDDMIVSGGENVFPPEIEDLIAGHPKVVEAAVIGVPDAQFGQRLKAFVVPATGPSSPRRR